MDVYRCMFGVILSIRSLYVVPSYVVNIESWSPINSIGCPSISTVYMPTMSAMPTDVEDMGKKHYFIHVLNT